MSAQDISNYLALLGFTPPESKLYLTLVERGPLSILQASRASGIERTMIYRLVEDLKARGLIEVQLAFKSTLIKAVSASQLQRLVASSVDRATALQSGFDTFSQEIDSLQHSYSATKVLYFRGTDGLKQMQWNTLRAKKEMVSYVSRAFQESVGQKFLESYAQEWRHLRLPYRELKSETFESTIDSSQKMSCVDLGPTYRWQVAPSTLIDITHDMDIYNDVVAIYYWRGDEVFGVEIHNQLIAQMQRSVFDTLWRIVSSTT